MMDMDLFSRLLLTLYRTAGTSSIREFCPTALREIQALLPFDSAVWSHGSLANVLPTYHVWAAKGVPEDLFEPFKMDPDSRAAIAFAREQLSGPNILDVGQMTRGSFVGEMTARAEAQHVMAMSERNTSLDGFTVLVLGRCDAEHRFRPEDQILMRLLMPHLQALVLRNLESQVMASVVHRVTGDVGLAIVAHGVVVLQEPTFSELVQRGWPDFTGPRLPDAVLTAMSAGQPTLACDGATLHILHGDGHVMLIATAPSGLRKLTSKEFVTALEFAQGKSYVEVARSLGLSPETVRSRLRSVYEKLDIGDKAELSQRFAPIKLLVDLHDLI